MKYAYSTYTSDSYEVLSSPISYTELLSGTGFMYAVELVHRINGRIIRSTQTELITRIDDLLDASRVRGGNLTYLTSDNIPVGLSLDSVDTLGGIGCSVVSLPQAIAGEMGLFVDYSLEFNAIIPVGAAASNGNPVVEFSEEVSARNPHGLGEFIMVPIEADRPQRHDTYPFLSSSYVQTGRVVWLRQGPPEPIGVIPPPLSPVDVHWSEVTITRPVSLKIVNGTRMFFAVDYSYPMELRQPLPGSAWQPRLTYP